MGFISWMGFGLFGARAPKHDLRAYRIVGSFPARPGHRSLCGCVCASVSGRHSLEDGLASADARDQGRLGHRRGRCQGPRKGAGHGQKGAWGKMHCFNRKILSFPRPKRGIFSLCASFMAFDSLSSFSTRLRTFVPSFLAKVFFSHPGKKRSEREREKEAR